MQNSVYLQGSIDVEKKLKESRKKNYKMDLPDLKKVRFRKQQLLNMRHFLKILPHISRRSCHDTSFYLRYFNPLPYMPIFGSSNSAENRNNINNMGKWGTII